MAGPKLLLTPGEDSRVDVRRELDGGASLTITPNAVRYVRLSRENAIGVALGLLKAVGVPIEEVYRRQITPKMTIGG